MNKKLESLSDKEILKRAESYGYRVGNILTGGKFDRKDAILYIKSIEKKG